jgi:hypothetical protein
MEKYRVWFVINPPNEPNYCSVESPEKGADFIKEQIKNQSKIRSIISNAFGLEVAENGIEFTEWYNEVGEDVNEAFGLEE